MTDKLLNKFFLKRGLSKHTETIYRIPIKHYSDCIGLTPSEFIAQAREDQVNEPWMDNRQIEEHQLFFKQYLEQQGKTPRTIKQQFSIVRIFYKHHQIELPRVKMPIAEDDQRFSKLLRNAIK